MGSFSTGFWVGLGLSLLFAPKKGEEMRQLVGERIRYLQSMPQENRGFTPLGEQGGTRLQGVQTRVEPARPVGATAPTVSPVQATPTSMEEVQRELNRATLQMGATTPVPGTIQETPTSIEETQKDLNRVTRQPGTGNPPLQRRPGSLADQ